MPRPPATLPYPIAATMIAVTATLSKPIGNRTAQHSRINWS
jgi:hypothetical protein